VWCLIKKGKEGLGKGGEKKGGSEEKRRRRGEGNMVRGKENRAAAELCIIDL